MRELVDVMTLNKNHNYIACDFTVGFVMLECTECQHRTMRKVLGESKSVPNSHVCNTWLSGITPSYRESIMKTKEYLEGLLMVEYKEDPESPNIKHLEEVMEGYKNYL